MLVVMDTNVLVSGLWSRSGESARLLGIVQTGKINLCYDHRILTEYHEVLRGPKFGFAEWEVADLLKLIERDGVSVVPPPLDIPFTDISDKIFYETAKYCRAPLITGNLKHFPNDECVITVRDFLDSRFK